MFNWVTCAIFQFLIGLIVLIDLLGFNRLGPLICFNWANWFDWLNCFDGFYWSTCLIDLIVLLGSNDLVDLTVLLNLVAGRH